MAIRPLPPTIDPIWWCSHPTSTRVPPQQLLIDIDHEYQEVYIGPNHMLTSGLSEKRGANPWCYVKDFKEACPEKWRDIQAKIVLQKLKDS